MLCSHVLTPMIFPFFAAKKCSMLTIPPRRLCLVASPGPIQMASERHGKYCVAPAQGNATNHAWPRPAFGCPIFLENDHLGTQLYMYTYNLYIYIHL